MRHRHSHLLAVDEGVLVKVSDLEWLQTYDLQSTFSLAERLWIFISQDI
jgi:hypothetical protein